MMMKTKTNDNFVVSFKGRIAQKKRIETYIQEVLRHYLPSVRRIIDIHIEVSNRLDEGCYGYCLGNRKNIEIELARGSNDEDFDLDYMMLNLAHELIHAKQYLKGEIASTHYRWKGNKDYGHLTYSRWPWEREAYKNEERIYEDFWVKRVDNTPHKKV